MSSRRRFLAALAVCLFLVALPLSGGALGAVAGQNGVIAFFTGTEIDSVSTDGVNTLATLVLNAHDPAWSADGKKLAYVDSSGAIISCPVAACSTTTIAAGPGNSEPAWSPDGTKVAYVNGGDIFVKASDGTGSATNLTNSSSAGNESPTWSPDGTKIAYDASSGGFKQLFTMNSTTGVSQVEIDTGASAADNVKPNYSPDGTKLAFESNRLAGLHQIYTVVVSSGSSSVVRVTNTSETETAPSYSPDGTKIAFARTSGVAAGVYTELAAGGTATELAAGGTAPDWQPLLGNATSPVITNGSSATQGQLLFTTNGTWFGATTGFAYQWRQCNSSGTGCSAISGATSSTYAVLAADVGHTLDVVVTATFRAGGTATANSGVTSVVQAAGVVNPPTNTAPPVIDLPLDNTVPMVGDFVSTTAGSWSGTFPMTFTYQWSKCPAADPLNGPCFSIPGATSSFFTVPASLYGMRFRVTVTATNSAAAVRQSSVATEIVTAIVPRLTGTPPITGQNIVDQTLSVDTGVWQGSTPITYAYQWRRCDPVGSLASCVAIAGAVTSAYKPQVADIGFSLRVYITASNAAGSGLGITNHTFPVVDKQHFAPSTQTQPSIAGLPVVGGQLTAGSSSFDGDVPIATNRVWQRCDATGARCHTIASATKTVYSPTLADVGSTLRVAVAAKNAYGSIIALSDPTDPVQGLPPHRKGLRIVGTAKLHYLLGTPYDDVLIGGPGNETIDGGGGYDTIRAGSGNTVITVRGPGNSRIYGGQGSSTIYAANGYKDYIYCVGAHDKVVADAFDVVKNCKVVQGPVGSTPGPR